LADAGSLGSKEPSPKFGRKQDKKDASGEGGKEKKEKKKAGAAQGAGRGKSKPSPQTPSEPTDGSAPLSSTVTVYFLHEYVFQYFGD